MKPRPLVFAALLAALCPITTALAQTPAPPPQGTTSVAVRSEMPTTFKPVRIRLLVDGEVRYDEKGPFAAWIPTGDHQLQVIADYRLEDPLFSYMKGFAIAVQSTHAVHSRGRALAVLVRVVDRGGATTPLAQRPQLIWSETAH